MNIQKVKQFYSENKAWIYNACKIFKFTLYYVHFFSISVHKYIESRSLRDRFKGG